MFISIDNFYCSLIISVLAFVGVFWLLTGYPAMEAFGLASNSDIKSKTPINHVIVISQGKRSFDNYFGTYPGANSLPANLTVPLNPFIPPSLKFTVASWFNTNETLPINGYLVNKGGFGLDTEGSNMNYGIWMNRNGNIIAGFESKNGTDHTVGSNNKYNDGKWHQAVVTYDGTSALTLFMDGNPVASSLTIKETPDISGTQPIRIGSNSLHSGNYFKGYVDEVRIWNKTLGNSEVSNGYHDNTYNTDDQFVYISFKDFEKKSNNANTSGPPQLKGIYLNGSSYKDVIINTSQYTNYVKPFHLEYTKTEIPYHGSKAYRTSYNNGSMNGFLFTQLSNGQEPSLVMGYYDDRELPHYWKLASEFVLADNFFAPTMDTGLANHIYLYTASSEDYQKNISFSGPINPNRTIFDQLEKGGLSWRVYVENYDPALNYTNEVAKKNRFTNLLPAIPRFVDNKTLNSNIVDLVEYFQDLRTDNFPAVSYIVTTNSEESSPRDVSIGQEFVASLVLAVMKSKHWNDSAIIITYRESGGWYDHVSPPIIDGQTYGFRVPTLIISPFAKRGYVDDTLYDVTSILKFIEYNYNLSSLAKRDADANNILNAFDFTKLPREPIILNPDIVQIVDQKTENIADNNKNVTKVSLLYLAIIPLIPSVGLIIWWFGHRR
jgi:phospholipase C